MPLGFAGSGGAWSAAATLVGAPTWPSEILYGLGAAFWVGFTALYVVNGVRHRGTFRGDLRHPFTGPFAAYIPLVATLLAAHYSSIDRQVFEALVWVSVAALAIVGAQLFAHWLTGGTNLEAVHPGYFIPVVAGANVASIGLSTVGAHDAAIAAFGAGVFFWITVSIVVLIRLVTHGVLPAAATPSLAAFLAAAATSNLAWLISHPGPQTETQVILLGALVMMLLVQGVLLPTYARLPFSLNWWTFTFPLASTTNFVVRWLGSNDPTLVAVSWSLLAVDTIFLGYVAAQSVAVAARRVRRVPTPGPRRTA